MVDAASARVGSFGCIPLGTSRLRAWLSNNSAEVPATIHHFFVSFPVLEQGLERVPRVFRIVSPLICAAPYQRCLDRSRDGQGPRSRKLIITVLLPLDHKV